MRLRWVRANAHIPTIRLICTYLRRIKNIKSPLRTARQPLPQQILDEDILHLNSIKNAGTRAAVGKGATTATQG